MTIDVLLEDFESWKGGNTPDLYCWNASHQLMMNLSHPGFLRCGSWGAWAHARSTWALSLEIRQSGAIIDKTKP